jgi:hypothetical protein
VAPELEPVLDPRGVPASTAASRLARRAASLEGQRLGLLNNGKPNAAAFLERLAELLGERFGVTGTTMLSKPSFAVPAGEAMLSDLAQHFDVVVAGVGDCGSCSAATAADGVLLEARGVPAVSIVTDIFRPSASAMAALKGFPDYRFVAVPHPIASLDKKELDAVAESAIPEVLAILGVTS